MVILRNGGLVHGGTEIRSIGEALGKRVVGKKTQAVRITAAEVDVTRVVPALRAVFEEIDGADRESQALNDSIGATRGQRSIGHEGKRFERAARAERSGPRKRVVD